MRGSEAFEIMQENGVEYTAVLDVDRHKGKTFDGAALDDNIESAMRHALQGIDREAATYIAMSVKEGKVIRPPDDEAEGNADALQVKRRNKAWKWKIKMGCMQAELGMRRLATPTTTTGKEEHEDYEAMDEEVDPLKRLLASMDIYRKVCEGISRDAPSVSGETVPSGILNFLPVRCTTRRVESTS